MRIIILLSVSLIFIACKQGEAKTNAEKASIQLQETAIKDESLITNADTIDIWQYRKEGVVNVFQNYKIFASEDIIHEDFNGDSIVDIAKLVTVIDNRKMVVIIDGKTGNVFNINEEGRTIDYWGITRDSTTHSIIFDKNNDMESIIVSISNPSIFVRKDEAGGGVITHKDNKYEWIHQSD